MSISAEREGDNIYLYLPMQMKDRAKEVAGARYDSKRRAWKYPLSWAHCVMLRGVFGPELKVGPELAHWAMEEIAQRVEPATQAREAKE